MKNLILLTFIFISLFAKAQYDELIEKTWYLQKIIIDESEYITPINEEVSEARAHFYDTHFGASVCNSLGGIIEHQIPDQSFTLSSFTFEDFQCQLEENFVFESLYFQVFFLDGSGMGYPFNYSIVDGNNYQILTITSSTGDQAIYHSQNTVSISKIDHLNSRFSIYPNPAFFKIFIQNLENRESLSFNMTNILGLQMMSTKLRNDQTEIDISHLITGVYLIRIYNENDMIVHTEKIIIK